MKIVGYTPTGEVMVAFASPEAIEKMVEDLLALGSLGAIVSELEEMASHSSSIADLAKSLEGLKELASVAVSKSGATVPRGTRKKRKARKKPEPKPAPEPSAGRGSNSLDSGLRDRLITILEGSPGMPLSDICDVLEGSGWDTSGVNWKACVNAKLSQHPAFERVSKGVYRLANFK